EEQGQFEAGEAVGKWLLYYESGALARESFHKNDRPTGQWTYFNEDGTLKETRVYKDGQWIE
ncbi:toxin-antitoxin system YwqK family antitoxin, partial [Shewanella sp. 0m-11]